MGTDEIVAKCPLFKEGITDEELTTIYDSIFYESQTLKLLPYYKHMAEIKEEIIEYNPDLLMITRYCVIVERASNTLQDLLRIWNSKIESDMK